MADLQIPSFGFANNQQSYNSPKTYHPSMMYQPMPAIGTPSFGGLGRPMTPKEHSRHSSYSTKDLEPSIQPIQPSVERARRHREYYLEGGDIYFLVRFRALLSRYANHSLIMAVQVENYLFRVHRYARLLPVVIDECGGAEANDEPRYFFERESPVFRKQFADIALNGHHRVGASDNEPLVLNDVRTDDFSRFLWIFYNPCVYFIPTFSLYPGLI